jgi:hypothetical protein
VTLPLPGKSSPFSERFNAKIAGKTTRKRHQRGRGDRYPQPGARNVGTWLILGYAQDRLLGR